MKRLSYAEHIRLLVAQYEALAPGEMIRDYSRSIRLGKNVCMTHKAVKHIVEQRGGRAQALLLGIPLVLTRPTKIADNSYRRENSFLFARMNGKARAVVVEITKTPDGMHQVVSAFPMHKHTYRKLVDVSGGPHVPSLDIA